MGGARRIPLTGQSILVGRLFAFASRLSPSAEFCNVARFVYRTKESTLPLRLNAPTDLCRNRWHGVLSVPLLRESYRYPSSGQALLRPASNNIANHTAPTAAGSE